MPEIIVDAASGAASWHISNLVNLTAVPIFDAVLLASSRSSLLETGVASFPNFLDATALEAAASEAVSTSASAWITDSEHNAWQTARDGSRPATHLVNLFMRTRVASIAFDKIGPTLHALYEAPELLTFLSNLLGKKLYRLADPLGACSINVFRDGWDHAWHYDEAEYTVTLSLQQADEGGDFVFTPPLRKTQSELALGSVASVLRAHTNYSFALDDDDDNAHEHEHGHDSDGRQANKPANDDAVPVRTAPFAPGTLQVFAGRYSLHAVTRTSGTRERLVAVLCFATEPNVRNTPAVQEMFWGRVISE
jgi:hypothetical protein